MRNNFNTITSSSTSSTGLTDLQQCIRDCLRLAKSADLETNPERELWRLSTMIEIQVQKELDAWKSLMGAETVNKTTEYSWPVPQ